MKRTYFAILTVLYCGCASPFKTGSTPYVATYIKVWGYLKYFDPRVCEGKVDWDSSFIAHYPEAANCTSKSEFANVVSELFHDGGTGRGYGLDSEFSDPQQVSLLDTAWMSDSKLFTPDAQLKLHGFFSNQVLYGSHYISSTGVGNPDFGAESSGDTMPYPNEAMRMLALARYWNAIEYFAPDKDVIGELWDSVLIRFIPQVAEANDAEEYQFAMLKCCCSIHDAHSITSSAIIRAWAGKYFLPFEMSFVGNDLVVDRIFPNSNVPFREGDRIIEINGHSVGDRIKQLSPLVPASNDASKYRNICWLLDGVRTSDSVLIKFERDGQEHTSAAYPITQKDFSSKLRKDTAKHWHIINSSVGYIDMGNFTVPEVGVAMKELDGTKAIIFDVRNYPKGTLWSLSSYLPVTIPWVSFRRPNIRCPGTFSQDNYSVPIKDSNSNRYKGKVLILVNENTQSHAEYTVMMLKAVPNAIVIGSQTAGADGNVSRLVLPGGITTMFSGLGVFYPDGKPTQRVGIIPDIEIKPTLAGIRAGRDEVLEKAIEIAKQ